MDRRCSSPHSTTLLSSCFMQHRQEYIRTQLQSPFKIALHLDILLDSLEENRSLTGATIRIRFTEPSLRRSLRRAAIENRLRCLRMACCDSMDGRAPMSIIGLWKGAELEFDCCGYYAVCARVDDVLSNVSATHLSNLPSSTSMAYRAHTRRVQLRGPNGTASFSSDSNSDTPFVKFSQLPLVNVRRLHLDTHDW